MTYNDTIEQLCFQCEHKYKRAYPRQLFCSKRCETMWLERHGDRLR